MQNKYLTPIKLLFSLLVVANSCAQASNPKPGITYKELKPDAHTTVYVLTVDPIKYKIQAARSQELDAGLASVDRFAHKFAAIAAINGGYFRFNKPDSAVGLPAGVLKINNFWYGVAYKNRGAIGWDPNSNKVLIDILQTKSKLTIAEQTFPINALNKIAANSKAYLLSSSYTDPITVAPHTAITFKNNKVVQVNQDGDISVPSNSYVYHLAADLSNKLPTIKVGDRVKLDITVQPLLQKSQANTWQQLPFIVGGGPVLINNNRVITDFGTEKLLPEFVTGKYARTAIGILPNKHWVFVVAMPHLFDEQGGMTIPELAQFMRSMGCNSALNLDGGQSSAMYLDAQFDSSIIIAHRHPVADAILVIAK